MSHLHPVGGKILASRVSKRLERRLVYARNNKQPGLFLSMTYDHGPYDPNSAEGPENLWDTAQKEKHVHVFMEMLESHLGRSLKGCWTRKAEFQTGGWLHYHVILLGVPFIPHHVLKDCWEHGHIFVTKIRPKHAHYMAKYQGKAGAYPDFLLDKPSRSVKIWGTSPGFWSPVETPTIRLGGPRVGKMPDSLDDLLNQYDIIPERPTNREVFDEADKWTNVVCDQTKHATRLRCDMGSLVIILHASGCEVEGNAYGALLVGATLQDAIVAKYHINGAYEKTTHQPEHRGPQGGLSAGAPASGEAASLYLIPLQDRSWEANNGQLNEEIVCPIPAEQWPDEAAPF